MSHSAERFAAKLLPFLGMGVFIVLFIFGLMVLSYVLIIGAVIGLILFLINYIRTKFSHTHKKPHHLHQHRGRTIDHDNQ